MKKKNLLLDKNFKNLLTPLEIQKDNVLLKKQSMIEKLLKHKPLLMHKLQEQDKQQ